MAIFNIGGVRASLFPFNLNEFESERTQPYAVHKPIGGSRVHEKTSQREINLDLRGVLYPYKLGGLAEYEALEALLDNGSSFIVTRGQTVMDGLYVLTRLKRKDSYITKQGIGRRVGVEIRLESTSDATPTGGAAILTRLLGGL